MQMGETGQGPPYHKHHGFLWGLLAYVSEQDLISIEGSSWKKFGRLPTKGEVREVPC